MLKALSIRLLLLPLVICSSQLVRAAADTGSSPDNAILKQAVVVNDSDWKAQPSFSYREHEIKYKLDSDGDTKSRQSKTNQVFMLQGSPYERLLAVNNEPLGPEAQREEERKLANETAARKRESADQRRARLSKYHEERAEEHLLMQQMTAAFHFQFTGEEQVGNTDCLHFNAVPNPDYRPPVEKARVLAGMRGQIWIDKQAHHWVKVQAEVTRPIEFGFFLAKVKPGTSFELDQAPVGGVWLPRRFIQTVNASVFGLYGMRNRQESEYSDYTPNKPL